MRRKTGCKFWYCIRCKYKKRCKEEPVEDTNIFSSEYGIIPQSEYCYRHGKRKEDVNGDS